MRSFSLRTKWTAAMLLTGALPIALLAYRSITIQKHGLAAAEQHLEASVIEHAAQRVRDSLEETEEATRRVGMLLTRAGLKPDEARLELARDTVGRATALAQVAVYGPAGELWDAIARKGATAGASLATLPASVLQDESTAGKWLAPEHTAGGTILRYAEPVDRPGAARVWVLGTLDGAVVSQRLEEISRDQLDARRDGVLLVDSALRVMAGGGAGPLAIGESLAAKDVFAGQVMTGNPFSGQYAFSHAFTAANGEEMSGSVRSIPERGWALAARRSQSAAYSALLQARNELLLAGAGFAILAIALGAWLAARTTRPVKKLVGLTEAYAQRRFGERSVVRTGDELEELGTSMEVMATQLSAGEAEIARRAAVESGLSRYLPAEVAKSIAEGKATLRLGGERRKVTVMFADVVSFTKFAEGAEPERVVAFLNELFSVLTEVVFRHGGTVDKFLGDCLMAIFGAPNELADHATHALAAAEDMHRFVEANGPAWKKTYGIDVRLGIGVNTGDALIGNLGSETRMEYTAIGDVVNVAARLEGLARPGQTLLTREVAALVGDGFGMQSLGEHPLRGKRQAIEVYELK